MKTIKFFILSMFFLATNYIYSQTEAGYKFSEYPAKKIEKTKAKINYSSNSTGSSFKTQIKEQYKNGKVDFGGHYITITWGAGAGLTVGAMVDIIDGKIYDLPLSEENSYRGTHHRENNNILYKPNSNLFICYSSLNSEKEGYVNLNYSIYKWNDKAKKFSLIKTKEITEKQVD